MRNPPNNRQSVYIKTAQNGSITVSQNTKSTHTTVYVSSGSCTICRTKTPQRSAVFALRAHVPNGPVLSYTKRSGQKGSLASPHRLLGPLSNYSMAETRYITTGISQRLWKRELQSLGWKGMKQESHGDTACTSPTHSNFALYALENFKFNS